MATLRITNAAEVVTGTEIIAPGEIFIKDDTIVTVGKPQEKDADITIDATGKTVTPGFIDCHTHLVFAGARDFELDMKLKGASYHEIAQRGGIHYTVELTRNTSNELLYQQAYKRLNTMLSYGTTTVEAKSGYGLDLSTEIKILEVTRDLDKIHPLDIIPTFMGAHAVPKGITQEDYVALIIDSMIPTIGKMKLARFCDVFCEKNYFTLDQSHDILKEGQRHGLRSKIHADEFTSCGGAELAAEVKAISAEHLGMASDRGITKMVQAGVTFVLLPATPFSLPGETYAPARKMLSQGARVALATDLNPNCWTESMQFIIQLACYRMGLTPLEAITAATLHAAEALGIENSVGSIEPGKKADLVILQCPSHRFLPYHFGVNLVQYTIKNGKVHAPC